jgi:hypothetical protein
VPLGLDFLAGPKENQPSLNTVRRRLLAAASLIADVRGALGEPSPAKGRSVPLAVGAEPILTEVTTTALDCIRSRTWALPLDRSFSLAFSQARPPDGPVNK